MTRTPVRRGQPNRACARTIAAETHSNGRDGERPAGPAAAQCDAAAQRRQSSAGRLRAGRWQLPLRHAVAPDGADAARCTRQGSRNGSHDAIDGCSATWPRLLAMGVAPGARTQKAGRAQDTLLPASM
eukprot:301522-Chlamydomonas_euryale.AAC.4